MADNDYRPEARIIAAGIADAGRHIGQGIADGLKAIASAMSPRDPGVGRDET